MTREEAINIISQMIKDEEGFLSDNTVEAHKIAIKALEQEPCGDVISRRAVLDINENHHGLMPNHVNHQIWKEIKALPSVTPAGKQEPCEDVISRQAVIDAMYKLCDTGETLKENPWRDNPHIDAVIETIEELPPVTSQSKHEDIAKAFQFGMAFGFIDGLANKTQESEDKE